VQAHTDASALPLEHSLLIGVFFHLFPYIRIDIRARILREMGLVDQLSQTCFP